MNKKVIGIIVVAVIIIAVVVGIVLSKGGSGSGSNNTSGKEFELTYDFSHMNNKTYSAKLNLNSDDTIAEFDKEEPNIVEIENEKNNYALELTLDTEAKEAYEQFKTSAKEDNEVFKEAKFGKYEGYYSKNNDDFYGYVLLDSSDSTFNVFLMFNLYLNDESKESSDIQAIYNSSEIQNILGNVTFKSK